MPSEAGQRFRTPLLFGVFEVYEFCFKSHTHMFTTAPKKITQIAI